MTTIPNRGVPDIVVDLMKEFTTLLRREVRLARAEVSEKISIVGMGLALIVVGAVLAMAGLVILLEALVAVLVEQTTLTPSAAAGIVGLAVFIIAVILTLVGVSRLKAENLAPKRTVGQLQRDAAVAKHQVTSR
jgi:uncharacterized membrane protein YqjE